MGLSFGDLSQSEQAAVTALLQIIVPQQGQPFDRAAMEAAVQAYRQGGVGAILDRLSDDATLPRPGGGADIPRRSVRIRPFELVEVVE